MAGAYPKGLESFACLGGHGEAIPVGWRGSPLACPEFDHCGFCGQNRLNAMPHCSSHAPVVWVSSSFSEGERITARWNGFVKAGEALVAQGFDCHTASGGTRLCVNHEVQR